MRNFCKLVTGFITHMYVLDWIEMDEIVKVLPKSI